MLYIHSTNKTFASILVAMLFCVYAHPQNSPADISGLQLWLRADSGITLNGNFVAQWDDQSGNNHHATSAFDVIRPTLLNNAINGLPAVSFDGSEDFLQFPLIDDVRTVFWVLRENPNSTNVPPRPLLGWSGGLTYLRGDNKEFWNGSFADPAVINGSSRLNFININGAQTIVPTEFCIFSLVTTAPLNANHLTMELNIYGRTWWGEMAEVLIYNEPLSVNEIAVVENYLADKYTPTFTAMPDVVVDYGFCDTLLCAPDGYAAYLWNGNSTGQCFTANAEGQYTLQLTDAFGRIFNDTVTVTYPGMLNIPNATICLGDAFIWDTMLEQSDYIFNWSDGTTNHSAIISEENNYTLTVTDTNSCAYTTNFIVQVDSFSVMATLGNDLALCAGNSIGLTEHFDSLTYLWSTNEITDEIVINASGSYWLEATNANNCTALDTIYIDIIGVAPVISFTNSIICEDQAATFSGENISSSNINSWLWNFGDGTNASGQTVVHEFGNEGFYLVQLTTTTQEGCFQTFEQSVYALAKPMVEIYATAGCDNEPISFSGWAQSPFGNVITWQWLIDGVFYNSQNVNALIDDVGAQNVILAVTTDLGCSAEVSETVFVFPSPAAEFTVEETCEGSLTQFSQQVDASQSGAIQQYIWNFGDNTGSTLANPSHFYSQDGEYVVTLIAHAFNSCSDTISQAINIYALPVADFLISNACIGQPYTLQNTSVAANDVINAWIWEVGNQVFTEENPQVIFDMQGLQPVQLSVTTSNGCTATVQQQIPVWPIPVAAFSYSPEIGEAPFECQFFNESQGATQAHWFFGDTYESNEYSPLHVFTLNGTAYTQLIAISAAGCRDTTGRIIYIAAPALDVLIQSVQCTETDLGQRVTAQLINTGNITITEIIMSYQVGNDAPVLEVWNGALPPASSINFTFTSYLQRVGQQFPYICVTAETSPMHYTELNLADNQYCKPLENAGLEVFPPYPNPGEDRMFIRFITPVEGDLKVMVFDTKGRVVIDLEDEKVPKGYHQYFLDISQLASGTYKLQLEMKTAKSVVSFMKVAANR